jgi:arylsulfatase A-like enzyme
MPHLARIAGLALAVPALLAGCGSPSEAHASSRARGTLPENVILISIDTLRQDHVGCYGYERDTTPNIDALAKESMLFEKAYTTMSWTLIAHMGMLTGLYPSQHKVWKEDAVLAPSVPTLAERLRGEGYHTIGFYDKTAHWVDPEFGYDRGFEKYVAHVDAVEASEHVRAALAGRPADKPFFLFLHLFDVHNAPLNTKGATIYDPPAPFDDCFVSGARERVAGADTKKWWYSDASDATPEQHEAVVALYDAGVRYVDSRLGELFAEWKKDGIFDRSMIIVTADHGEGLCDHNGRFGGHGESRQEGLLVPLIVKLPGGKFAGTRVADPVSHVDLLPTILDSLGLAADARLPGYSLLAGRPADTILYAERDETQVLIRWPYKLIQSPTRKEVGTLFDLSVDPHENQPLRARGPEHARYDEIVRPLRAAALADRSDWFQPEAGAERAAPMDAAMKKRMAEMGYAGETEPEAESTTKATDDGGDSAHD